jgi:hypothetical protein
MHELLIRKWKGRVKGRDWFDLEWYFRKAIPLHLKHLEIRARDSGDWSEPEMGAVDFLKILHEKIDQVSMDQVRQNVLPFIQDAKVLDIWSPHYFHKLEEKIRIV